MRQKLRPHLTFANVVSAIALFVALATGGAYAANTIGSSDVIDDSLLTQDIKGKPGTSTTAAVNGTLTGADISGQQANATVGQPFVQGSLTTFDIKNNSLTGDDVDESTLKLAAESFHEVGSAGEPPFLGSPFCPWKNTDPSTNSAGFLRDRAGFVHLKGLVDVDEGDSPGCDFPFGALSAVPIFTLTDGYHPAKREVHGTVTNDALGEVLVDPNGNVSVAVPPTTKANALVWVSLDGITFRCAPSGTSGCP